MADTTKSADSSCEVAEALNNYRPTLHHPTDNAGYMELIVPVLTCPYCKRSMVSTKIVDAAQEVAGRLEGPMLSQVIEASCSFISTVTMHGYRLCVRCVGENIFSVACHLCKTKLSRTSAKCVFGKFENGLCLDCYETTPAVTWDQAVRWLQKMTGL